jgi:pyruvate-formate lyase-activating enzyme
MNDKKILCLGNNTRDTDLKAKLVAREQNLEYHGLITEVKKINQGCYQTSFYDMSYGDLIKLSKNMDDIIILDQPKESYLDEYAFHQTISLGKHLKSTCNVIFLNQSFNLTIEDELKTNKSMCLLPFIQSVPINGQYYACCRSTPISKFDPSIKYSEDSNRNAIKQKMLAGEKLDQYCESCYKLEEKEIVSPRITQTIEWANRLNIRNVNDAAKITSPVYYEVRASNQCNLMCRMCDPRLSNLIAKENKKLKIFNESEYQYTGFDYINIDIDNIEKLYVAGGEPTVMPELHKFLEDCIEKGKTNFEIQLNTNAVSLNKKFKSLLKHFDNFNFEISVDGYRLVNQYIRWPTNWDKLINNIDYIYNQGHNISFNSVVSIYNITSLYSTIEFLSDRYKKIPIHLTPVIFAYLKKDILSPYIFPDAKLVIDNLAKIKKLEIYHNDLVFKIKIDEYQDYFKNKHTINLSTLESFFEYNDKLDESRNIKLIDYIPELDQYRSLINRK